MRNILNLYRVDFEIFWKCFSDRSLSDFDINILFVVKSFLTGIPMENFFYEGEHELECWIKLIMKISQASV